MQDDLKLSFSKLFAVDLHHLYYTSALAENLAVVPTAESAQVMRNHGMIFRSTPKGFTVLQQAAEDSAGRDIPLRPWRYNGVLTFLIKSLDREMLNCSELPLSGDGQIYYFNNLSANAQDGRLLLSADTDSPYVTSADRLPLHPLQFSLATPSEAAQVQFTLSDAWGRTLDTRTIAVAEGRAVYSFDLTPHGPGRYGLSMDGGATVHFYAGTGSMVSERIFGLIEIHYRATVPYACHVCDPASSAIMSKTFALVINSRRTLWRYYFVHKYRLTEISADRWPASWPADFPVSMPADWPDDWPDDWPRHWVVSYPNGGGVRIDPRPAEMKVMPDGRMAIPFVSNQRLPLQQAPVRGIGLHYTGGNGGGSGISPMENLPSPAKGALVPENAGVDLFSDVYVYL